MNDVMWRSTNSGRTWDRIEVHPRSPLAAMSFEPGEIYDDGYGNLYCSTPPERTR